MKKTIAAAVAAIGIATALAPAANATPEQDYIYFSLLENNGFHITRPTVAKQNADIVCSTLRAGTSWRIVMTRIMDEADYDLDTAALIMTASLVAYCPDATPAELQTQAVA